MADVPPSPRHTHVNVFLREHDAYSADRKTMQQLGLRTTGFRRDWTDLGTVVVQDAQTTSYGNPSETQQRPPATVTVEVSSMPAIFWRFTITRPRDATEHYGIDDQGRELWRAVYEPVERFVIETGSGRFGDFWPTAKAMADGMLNVSRLA